MRKCEAFFFCLSNSVDGIRLSWAPFTLRVVSEAGATVVTSRRPVAQQASRKIHGVGDSGFQRVGPKRDHVLHGRDQV